MRFLNRSKTANFEMTRKATPLHFEFFNSYKLTYFENTSTGSV